MAKEKTILKIEHSEEKGITIDFEGDRTAVVNMFANVLISHSGIAEVISDAHLVAFKELRARDIKASAKPKSNIITG